MAEKKVAHKEKKPEEPFFEAPKSNEVERSNIARQASLFEEDTKQYEAQDRNLYIPGLNGHMRLRHASDGYSKVAEKQQYEKDNANEILAQLKKEKEETKKKLEALAEKKKAEEKRKLEEQNKKYNQEAEEMHKEWDLFCQTLDVKHHDKAIEMWNELAENGHPQDQLKANTKQIYAKSFTFDDISSNDDVVGILSDLDIAQTNFNMNP